MINPTEPPTKTVAVLINVPKPNKLHPPEKQKAAGASLRHPRLLTNYLNQSGFLRRTHLLAAVLIKTPC
jgi:hypothetical protein